MSTLSGLRFVFVTGKGGVGKSTVSAILGAGLAKRGRKVLVAADAGSDALSYLFETPIGAEPTPIAPRLYGLRIEPKASMRQYAEDAIGSRLLSNAIFSERVAQGFLEGIPGLLGWALLGKAWYATTDAKDGPELPHAPFDTVIFDGFSTGDGTELLRLPETLFKIAPVGRLRRDAQLCYELLRDGTRSRVLPVTLPRLLPATETEELVAEIRDNLGYPLGPLVKNQIRPLYLEEPERAQLLASLPGASAELDFLRERAALEQGQIEAEKRLEALNLPSFGLPFSAPPPRGVAGLAKLAEEMRWLDLEFS
jgi:anion-transporting  ArsA/GET3 family ATPase